MKRFHSKKVIFIDMGNTLLDFHQGLSDAEKDQLGLLRMQSVLKTKGYSISLKMLEDDFLQALYKNQHIRMRDLIEVDILPALNKFGVFTDQIKLELLTAFYSVYRETVVVNDGALALLRYLNSLNLKVGIISNCYLPSALYKTIFIEKGLDAYIDGYTFSYDLGIRKPNPAIYLSALMQFNVTVDDALMIGDGFKPDILGSNSIHLDSIWYNPQKRPLLQPVLHLKTIIQNFNELIS